MYQNVEKWRGLPQTERRRILRAQAVKQVASSMAMEGEPVSELWIQQNSR